jgi:hypothetical protein
MKKLALLFALLIAFVKLIYSQDIIILKDGTIIKCKIIDITTAEVKFKNLNDPNNFIYKSAMNEIKRYCKEGNTIEYLKLIDSLFYKTVKIGDDFWMGTDMELNGETLLSWPFYDIRASGWHIPEYRDFKKLRKIARKNGWKMSDFLIGGKSGLNLDNNQYYWCTKSLMLDLYENGIYIGKIFSHIAFGIKNNKLDFLPFRNEVKLKLRLIKNKDKN